MVKARRGILSLVVVIVLIFIEKNTQGNYTEVTPNSIHSTASFIIYTCRHKYYLFQTGDCLRSVCEYILLIIFSFAEVHERNITKSSRGIVTKKSWKMRQQRFVSCDKSDKWEKLI